MHLGEKSPWWLPVLTKTLGVVLVLSVACGKSGSRSNDEGQENQAGEAGLGGSSGAVGGSAHSGRGGSSGASSGGESGEGGEGTGGGGAQNGGAGFGAGGSSAGAGASSGGSGAGTAGSGGQGPAPEVPEGCEARTWSADEDSCQLGVLCRTDSHVNSCIRLESGRWKCDCGRGRVWEIERAEGLLACSVMAELCPVVEPEPGELACEATFDLSNTNHCEIGQGCGRSHDVTLVPTARAWLMDYSQVECGRSDSHLPFECVCVRDETGLYYGLLSESGEGACQPLLDFCNSGATPTYVPPAVCVDTSSDVSSYGCQLHRTCATPMRLTDEVSLAKVEGWYADCTPAEPTGSSCYCSGVDETFTFDLAAGPVAQTCAASIVNCTDFGNVVPQGEVTCNPSSQTGGSDFCDADLACSQSATVDGREMVARGRMLVYCRKVEDQDPWRCSCASNEDSTIFELGLASSTSWDACSAASDRCVDLLPMHIGPYGIFRPPPDPLMAPE